MSELDAVITRGLPTDGSPPHLVGISTRLCTLTVAAIPRPQIGSTASSRWSVSLWCIRGTSIAIPGPSDRAPVIQTAILAGTADTLMRLVRRGKW